MSNLDGLGYSGATTVVVGCSTGIGEATVRILGELGARVHAASRHEPSVPCESFHPIDLTDFESIAAAANALSSIGPIDHVFTCSGVPFMRPPMEVVAVNFIGLRHLVESVVPAIVNGGNICVTGSSTAYGWEHQLATALELVKIADPDDALAWCKDRPELVAEGFPSYILSKQALITWVTYRAPSLAESRGIRLNCVSPGLTATPMVDEIAAQPGSRALVDAFPNPLFGRIPTAEEAAWPLVLLNSRKNAIVTGSVLFADQGCAAGIAAGAITFS